MRGNVVYLCCARRLATTNRRLTGQSQWKIAFGVGMSLTSLIDVIASNSYNSTVMSGNIP